MKEEQISDPKLDQLIDGSIHFAHLDRRLILSHYMGAKAAFLLEDEVLMGIWLESATEHSRVGEIYVGKIKSIADGIGAAFVEYAKNEVGFLPLNQIRPEMILNQKNPAKVACEQELLVQVVKAPMNQKDATLTTNLIFSGKYIVLTPYTQGIRFSRKLKKEDKRTLLSLVEKVLDELFGDKDVFLSHYGLIIRTNAVFAGFLPLFYELHELFHEVSSVLSKAPLRPAFTCLRQDAPFYHRILRDQYDLPHMKIVTDEQEIYDELIPRDEWDDGETPDGTEYLTSEEKERFDRFMESVRQKKERLGEGGSEDEGQLQISLWQETSYSLLSRYTIPSGVEKALAKRVWLKSGGFLVIEPTEALTVIDVNSGKASSRKKTPEDFNLRINMEAAVEIARQLRLRNLSGMIIVDFINLEKEESRRHLMHTLRRILRMDPVGANLIDMTTLGLVEITRRKKEPPLREVMHLIRQQQDKEENEAWS